VVVVIDGAGTTFTFGKENLTIFDMTKSDGKSPGGSKHLYKSVVGSGSTIISDRPDFVNKNTLIGPGFSYTAVTEALGFDGLDCGKTMGLSAFGKDNKSIPKLLSIDSCGNDTFKLKEPLILNNFEDNKYLKINDLGCCGAELRQTEFVREDLAYRIQSDYEEYLIQICKKALKLSKHKNLVLTGGCALNCVANYKLLKSLPEDVTLYVDPTCDDSSVSIGGVYNVHHQVDPQKDFTLKNLYKGRQMTYNFEYEDQYQATPKDIAELLDMGKVIAIAQGRSEIGPRALGNRSILFDPRVKDGKDIINRIKKREEFRPFAGTVLQEHAKEWFDMDRLDESPFMMYAVDVLPEKIEQIPSIVHVDGTCSVQTVTEEQNKNYYDVISEFHKITGVPILFNTSFNLAGDTMVDTIEDALYTLHNSEIEYLYLPEISTLVRVAND
jgi:carbamoyltransferase